MPSRQVTLYGVMTWDDPMPGFGGGLPAHGGGGWMPHPSQLPTGQGGQGGGPSGGTLPAGPGGGAQPGGEMRFSPMYGWVWVFNPGGEGSATKPGTTPEPPPTVTPT